MVKGSEQGLNLVRLSGLAEAPLHVKHQQHLVPSNSAHLTDPILIQLLKCICCSIVSL